MSTANLVTLEDVGFRYPLSRGGERNALEGVSLEICAGERLTVLGAAGAGKTTLAFLLAGLVDPTAGLIHRADALTAAAGSRLPVGLVTQNPEDTFASPLVREELALVLQNLDWEDRRIDSAVEGMLGAIGLGEYADQSPSFLSGGQKQLLALASILIADPLLLLLDEPLCLLDHRGREEVSSLLDAGGNPTRRSMVYLSSEVEDALRGDRILILSGGKVAWQGMPADLPLDEERLEEWGLVLPDLNRLAELLFPGRRPERSRLWHPGELARYLCRSG